MIEPAETSDCSSPCTTPTVWLSVLDWLLSDFSVDCAVARWVEFCGSTRILAASLASSCPSEVTLACSPVS